jgi:hypothetical protein
MQDRILGYFVSARLLVGELESQHVVWAFILLCHKAEVAGVKRDVAWQVKLVLEASGAWSQKVSIKDQRHFHGAVNIEDKDMPLRYNHILLFEGNC